MSLDHPDRFDYLTVTPFIPGGHKSDTGGMDLPRWSGSYVLTCVVRSSVHIKYTDNSTYEISFDAFNDQSQGFKFLKEKAQINAGEQTFEITSITNKPGTQGTISITAVQSLNAEFKYVINPKKMVYTTNKGTTKSSSKVYVTLEELMSWFWKSASRKEEWSYKLHGYFPRRPIDNPSDWNGQTLLSKITETWPGSVIIGWGREINIFGFQKERDESGSLVSVRELETNKRFDNDRDLKDISITRDASQMCNAIKVKSATYTIQPPKVEDENGDESEENQELVVSTLPYFPSFLAVDMDSYNKYGLYMSTQLLDNGFTNRKAALAMAREKMVTKPAVKITATLNHPGQPESQPITGHKYSIGAGADDKVYHVILRGYDWYPFDGAKGTQLTMNTVDPGLVNNLKSIIIHDVELSPSMTQFKALTDDGTTSSGSVSGSGEGSGVDGDIDDAPDLEGGDLPSEDVNESKDRPDDAGNGTDSGYPNDDNGSGAHSRLKAYLPISDKHYRAHISGWGNITVNNRNRSFDIRVTNDDTLKKLQDGSFTKADMDNDVWKHLFKIYISKGNWLGKHGKVQDYYHASDYYLGQLALFNSGLITTTSSAFTFRAGVTKHEYKTNGTLQHVGHKHSDGITYFDDASDEQPGELATIQAGKYVGRSTEILHYRSHSQLSHKKDVKPLGKKEALSTILDTDIATYHYKNDPTEEEEASVIIDDVHKTPQYKTPSAFITKDGKDRKDSVTVGYLVKAVQAQEDEIKSLKNEIKELKELIKNG